MNRTLNPAYRTRANRLLSAILIATVSFAAGLVSDANAAPQIELTPIVSGINSPLAITHAGDGSGRLFITLQVGRILIHDGQQVLPSPFLDIGALVSTDGERGLLSAAFHPNYVSNGFVYVNYTDLNGDTVVARYTVSADPNVADPASAVILLTISQPFANHNGGQLQFGPDGYLYIGTGDGGGGGDPSNNAQNLNSLLGKMLRIDVNAGPSYGIPPNNPFIGDPAALPEIWALGLRNPWRFSFDRLTGDLWIADVGQANLEELNIQTASSAGGENYGWRLMEGDSCFNPASGCNDGSLTLPVLQYDHSLAVQSRVATATAARTIRACPGSIFTETSAPAGYGAPPRMPPVHGRPRNCSIRISGSAPSVRMRRARCTWPICLRTPAPFSASAKS